MKNRIDCFILGRNMSFDEKEMLHYASRLWACVRSYNDGEINIDSALKTCKVILDEIDNPEFPFFAVRHCRELFSIIFFQFPLISSLRRALTSQSKG